MSNDPWPYPRDSPIVRARRVAIAYRSLVAKVDEPSCAVLDEQMLRWGQGWAVVHLLHFELDDWLTPRQAAELASVQVRHIAKMRRLGRLKGRMQAGSWQYRARDVIAVSSRGGEP